MIEPQFWLLLALVIPSIVVDLVLAIPSPRRQSALARSASPARRMSAYSVDLLIVAMFTLVLASTYGEAAGFVWPIMIVFVAMAYPMLCYIFGGRTIGQRVSRLRWIPESPRATLTGPAVLGFMVMLCGFPFGFVSIVFDDARRTADEKMSRSCLALAE